MHLKQYIHILMKIDFFIIFRYLHVFYNNILKYSFL
jgi:hypothetical protein